MGSALPADALAGSGNLIPTVLWWIQTTTDLNPALLINV